MSMDETRTPVVLLVEDSPDDQEFVRRAFGAIEYRIELHTVANGEEALRYVRSAQTGSDDASWPDLILLDLNMPGMDGREVLARLKEQPETCTIPVVVFTSSQSEEDVVRAYQLGCNSFVKKPVGREELIRLVELLVRYWFRCAILPTDASIRMS